MKNLTLFDNLCLKALFLAMKIAFFEISTPMPFDFLNYLTNLK